MTAPLRAVMCQNFTISIPRRATYPRAIYPCEIGYTASREVSTFFDAPWRGLSACRAESHLGFSSPPGCLSIFKKGRDDSTLHARLRGSRQIR
jgi:hypothetical protein